MSNKQNRQESINELALSTYYEQEALVKILVGKGIITKEELSDKIREVWIEHENKRREN